jgi:hypothetical protein
MGKDEQARQISAIYRGEMKVNEAHQNVQNWFEMSVYHMAVCVVDARREDRRELMEGVKRDCPDWYDDVDRIAKQLVRAVNN